MKVNVAVAPGPHGLAAEIVDAVDWDIDANGHLVFRGTGKERVAAFAPGQWLYVIAAEAATSPPVTPRAG